MQHALNDHFVIYMPKDIVSGDFYWLSEKKNKTFVTAVDCTGHGVPGAFMSMIGSSLLNKIVNENEVYKPSDVLDRMKKGVIDALNKEGQAESTNDGMDMSFLALDFKNNKLEFAGANNPLYIIRDGEMMIFKGDKQPVGAFVKEAQPFTNHEVDLKEGDMLHSLVEEFGEVLPSVKKVLIDERDQYMVGKLVEMAKAPDGPKNILAMVDAVEEFGRYPLA